MDPPVTITHRRGRTDEDKLCDVMEPMMAEGGNVVDFHSCEFFPERWFVSGQHLVSLCLAPPDGAFVDRLLARFTTPTLQV